MNEYSTIANNLASLLRGLLSRVPIHGATDKDAESAHIDMGTLLQIEETRRRALRRDPTRVLGSRHFATSLAYGNFMLASGGTIRCEAIPGISGVITSSSVSRAAGGQSSVALTRILTHFHFDKPAVLIEQNPSKESTGTLTAASDSPGTLLPGKATFSQYLILTLEGRPLANREPLVMTADRVEEWPPIGSSFISEAPTHFYDLAELDNPAAPVVATLSACNNVVASEIDVPRN